MGIMADPMMPKACSIPWSCRVLMKASFGGHAHGRAPLFKIGFPARSRARELARHNTRRRCMIGPVGSKAYVQFYPSRCSRSLARAIRAMPSGMRSDAIEL